MLGFSTARYFDCVRHLRSSFSCGVRTTPHSVTARTLLGARSSHFGTQCGCPHCYETPRSSLSMAFLLNSLLNFVWEISPLRSSASPPLFGRNDRKMRWASPTTRNDSVPPFVISTEAVRRNGEICRNVVKRLPCVKGAFCCGKIKKVSARDTFFIVHAITCIWFVITQLL